MARVRYLFVCFLLFWTGLNWFKLFYGPFGSNMYGLLDFCPARKESNVPKLKRSFNLKGLMPCPFTGHKTFCAGPNFLSQPKNLTSSKTFVPTQKSILLNANHLFVSHKMFVTATICKQIFGLAQKFWTSPKHFGTCKRTRHDSVSYWLKSMKYTDMWGKKCQKSGYLMPVLSAVDSWAS